MLVFFPVSTHSLWILFTLQSCWVQSSLFVQPRVTFCLWAETEQFLSSTNSLTWPRKTTAKHQFNLFSVKINLQKHETEKRSSTLSYNSTFILFDYSFIYIYNQKSRGCSVEFCDAHGARGSRGAHGPFHCPRSYFKTPQMLSSYKKSR